MSLWNNVLVCLEGLAQAIENAPTLVGVLNRGRDGTDEFELKPFLKRMTKKQTIPIEYKKIDWEQALNLNNKNLG